MRDNKIDICKGIGIILMVLGHAGMPHSSIIFRFHMALFFILSGYIFDQKKVDNHNKLISYIWRRIKSLYFPFVLWNGLLVLMNNIFIRTGIYTDNPLFLGVPEIAGAAGNWYGIKQQISLNDMINTLKQILFFQWEQQLGGATWFLRVLFGVSVLWAVITFVANKFQYTPRTVQWVMHSLTAVGLLFLSNSYQERGINGLTMQFETVAASYILYYFGYYFKLWRQQNSFNQEKYSKSPIVAIVLLCFVCLINCDKVCSLLGWDSNVNNYNYWPMYLTSSISGFLCVFFLADLFTMISNKAMNSICRFLSFTGRESLFILLLHFIAFKSITALQLVVFHQPLYRLASFPCFYNKGGWWILYTLAGVGIPLIISRLITLLTIAVKKSD